VDSHGSFLAIDAIIQVKKDRKRYRVWGYHREDSIAGALKSEGEDATQ
jgi:hypothetical protein